MIRQIEQRRGRRHSRKGLAVLFTFWLNLALLPCAMAIEIVEDGHDCCPPTVELQQIDCCELDSATSDKRGGKFESYDDLFVVSTAVPGPSLYKADISENEIRPPDPVDYSPPLHKIYCVYLD
jgi:hypothetical protein